MTRSTLITLTGWGLALALCVVSTKLLTRLQLEHARGKVTAALGSTSPKMPSNAPEWPPEALRVVFAGDSRIAHWPLPEPPSGIAFAKEGRGGETSLQLAQRLPALLDSHKPDQILLSTGINDLVAAALAPEYAPAIEAGLASNIDQMLQDSHKAGAEVVLSTVIQPTKPGLIRRSFAWDEAIHGLVNRANAGIIARANPPKVRIFDANAVLGNPTGPLAARYAADDLHQNATAYAALSEALLRDMFQ